MSLTGTKSSQHHPSVIDAEVVLNQLCYSKVHWPTMQEVHCEHLMDVSCVTTHPVGSPPL